MVKQIINQSFRKAQPSVVQRVNEMEDEDGDSDIDILSSTRKDLGISDLGHDSENRTHKVEWSDSEDAEAAYEAWRNRRTLKRKRATTQQREARKLASNSLASSKSVVGRKSLRHDTFDDIRPEQPGHHSKSLETSHITGDSELPDYVQARADKFRSAREGNGEAGLSLPPNFEDIDFSDDERMNSLGEKPQFSNIIPCAPYEDITLPYSAGIIPAPIAQWLRSYQVKGVEFMHELFVWQRGGILGDDMGLGKTIQVIAFLTAAFGKTGDERDSKRMRKIRRLNDGRFYPRVLIVCPGTLMENWESELSTWGWWDVYRYHGNAFLRDSAFQAASKGSAEIIITTYSTYRGHHSTINMIDWDCVIADECHMIKTFGSEITQAMNNINALCRIGLTGTVIQNKYEDLWTLLNWTNPGRFGSLASWRTCISEPLRLGQAHDATVEQLGKARKTADALVNHLLPQFFLRRKKTLIAHQLPKKSDRVVFCPLTDTQADAYKNFVNGDIVDYIRQSTAICSCSSGKKRGWCCYTTIPGKGGWQAYVFPAIMTLQKLANHVALLIPAGTETKEKQAKHLENLQVALPDQWRDLYRQKDSIINYVSPSFCGKWRILRRLLQFWHAAGDKVLVFSHSVRLLKMLQMLFNSTTSYNMSYLDGAMSYAERAQVVKEYNETPSQFVFLISTKAGGVGLNITSANKVVVVDPNWNPAYDLQAQDRAYRIGQMRDVEVFRLVSAGTIEEIVYARQIYKQQQANIGYNASLERRYFKGVQDRKEKKGEIFGLANLFSLRQGLVLRDIVNKTNIAESRAGVEVVDMNINSTNHGDGGDLSSLKDSQSADDGAINLMANLISEGKIDDSIFKDEAPSSTGKSDPIKAILASAGVQYTHENSEVIGSSKIETKLSKNALENETDLDLIGRPVFARTESQREDLDGTPELEGAESIDENVSFKYRPPEDVRKRQFCTMANTYGYEDATEFALVVESMTQSQRRDCLDRFFLTQRQDSAVDGKFQANQ